jgi:hypothetical protein
MQNKKIHNIVIKLDLCGTHTLLDASSGYHSRSHIPNLLTYPHPQPLFPKRTYISLKFDLSISSYNQFMHHKTCQSLLHINSSMSKEQGVPKNSTWWFSLKFRNVSNLQTCKAQ